MATPADDALTICRLLEASGEKLAVAESLTTGRVQSLIGSVSGASKVFSGGVTTYMLEQKVKHLGVNRAHAESVNAVSERVAEEMARGVRELFDASVGIATTGYAEPSPADGVAAPFAYVAANVRGRSRVRRVEGGAGGRTAVQDRVAGRALENLLAALRALISEDGLPAELERLRAVVESEDP